MFSGQNKRQTNFSISPDNKFIAIATDNIKKNSNSYDIHVFDSETLKPVDNVKNEETPLVWATYWAALTFKVPQ